MYSWLRSLLCAFAGSAGTSSVALRLSSTDLAFSSTPISFRCSFSQQSSFSIQPQCACLRLNRNSCNTTPCDVKKRLPKWSLSSYGVFRMRCAEAAQGNLKEGGDEKKNIFYLRIAIKAISSAVPSSPPCLFLMLGMSESHLEIILPCALSVQTHHPL